MASTAKKPEVTSVPVEGALAHMGAVVHYAVLAYPSGAEWPKRDEFVEHFKGRLAKLYVDGAALRDGVLWRRGKRPWARREKILPRYRTMETAKIEGVLNRAYYRIFAWRLPAAEMAWMRILHGQRVGPFLIRFGNPADPSWAPTSLNRAADRIAEMLEGKRKAWPRLRRHAQFTWDRASVMHRIWASTRPVLHLAMALPRGDKHGFDPLVLVHKPSWLLGALGFAEAMRLVLPQFIPSFDPDNAVRLLPEKT